MNRNWHDIGEIMDNKGGVKMKKVTFTFVGQEAEAMARQFYHWYVDGGLEDQVVDTLTDMGPSKVETIEIDNDTFDIVIGCSYQDSGE